MSKITYPLAKDTISREDVDALCEWLKTYPQLTKGVLTPRFEQACADWVGRKYAVFVNSGSSANLLMSFALRYSGKLKNNIVIAPEVGWITTIAPFLQANFEVKLCPTDPATYGMDLEQLDGLCKNLQPSIVIFVQPLGVLIDKDKLQALQMKYGFYLLEDCCGAVGSSYQDGIKGGKVGDMSSWSSFFAHQYSTIEGGLVFTDDKNLYNILISLRSHGWLRDNEKDVQKSYYEMYDVDEFNKHFFFILPGFNVRNTDIGAFIGLRQIQKLEEFASIRDRNHRRYIERLSKKFGIQDPSLTKTISSISFAFMCKDPIKRKMIVGKLNENGIENRLYSAGALWKHPFWKSFGTHDDVEYVGSVASEQVHDLAMFVPNNQAMTIQDVDNICDVILGA